MSALFSTLAVFCRQTNIILSVLNPALILLLRVFFTYFVFILVWVGLEEWEISETGNPDHSFAFFGILRVPVRSSSCSSLSRLIHLLPCFLREERLFGRIGWPRASFHVAASNAALLLFGLLLPCLHRWHRAEVVSLLSPPGKDQQDTGLELSFLLVIVFLVVCFWLSLTADSSRNSRLFIPLFDPITATSSFTFLKILWLCFPFFFSSDIRSHSSISWFRFTRLRSLEWWENSCPALRACSCWFLVCYSLWSLFRPLWLSLAFWSLLL